LEFSDSTITMQWFDDLDVTIRALKKWKGNEGEKMIV
jgi:hypothetical protein